LIPFRLICMTGCILLYRSYCSFKDYVCNYCILWFYSSYTRHILILKIMFVIIVCCDFTSNDIWITLIWYIIWLVLYLMTHRMPVVDHTNMNNLQQSVYTNILMYNLVIHFQACESHVHSKASSQHLHTTQSVDEGNRFLTFIFRKFPYYYSHTFN